MAETSPTTIDMTRFAAGRLLAAEIQPFLAVGLYALTPVAAPGLGTMGVDPRWRLKVDPDVVDRWTVPEIAGVLLHEVAHVVRDHHGRAESAYVLEHESFLWNVACDAEINDDLRDDEVVLPDHGVMPESLGAPPGRSAEHYFHLLRTGKAHPPHDHHVCGAPLFSPDDEEDAALGIHLVPGLDETEAGLIRHRIAVAITTALRLPGQGAGGWDRWAEAQLTTRLDWRTILRSRVRSAVAAATGASDYTYARPSRRRVPRVVLPAMSRPVPAVAVVIDTSGSVDDEMLAVAWTEVHGCLRSLGVRRDLLTAFAVDTEVRRLRAPYALTANLAGGGGTDMVAGIDAALALRPRPQLVVVLTDGYTPWPTTPPPCRVVVALLGIDEGGEMPAGWWPPDWATTVVVPSSAGSEHP